MAKFTTRVELHDARNIDDYNLLHSEMAKEGFTRTIFDEKNVKYQLPQAEYNYEGTETRAKILDKANVAAARTNKKYSILVTESAGRIWQNLNKV